MIIPTNLLSTKNFALLFCLSSRHSCYDRNMRTYLLGCSILSYHHHRLSNKGILVLLATKHSTPNLGQLGQCKSFANLLPDRRVSNHILSPFQRPEEEQWNSNRSTSSSSRAKTAPVPALSTWTKLEGQLPKELDKYFARWYLILQPIWIEKMERVR